jgi:glycosyltransferase involved in cell wall biosynthesis
VKIFIVLDSSNMGGIETHVHVLAKTLKQQGIDNEVILLHEHNPHHPLLERLNADQLHFRCLTGGIGEYQRILSEERPDVIHTHGYKAGILSRFAGKWLRIPVVSTFHAGEPGSGKLWLYNLADRHTARMASAVIAVSHSIGAKLPCQHHIIENFVELPPPRENTAHTIGFVGRLSYEKGPDLLIETARLLPQQTFAIYGDGPMLATLQATAPDNVQFMGLVSSMAPHWPHIGLLCMPSRHEGLPMAALEAMAQGIPVAAFAVGGLPALIQNGDNGWLAPPQQTQALAEQLQIWSTATPEQRQQIGQHARETIATRYSAEQGARKILAIYHAILPRIANPPPT